MPCQTFKCLYGILIALQIDDHIYTNYISWCDLTSLCVHLKILSKFSIQIEIVFVGPSLLIRLFKLLVYFSKEL